MDKPWWDQDGRQQVVAVEADSEWVVSIDAHETPDGWEYALVRSSYGSRTLLALFRNGQWVEGDPNFMPSRMAVKMLEEKFRAMGRK